MRQSASPGDRRIAPGTLKERLAQMQRTRPPELGPRAPSDGPAMRLSAGPFALVVPSAPFWDRLFSSVYRRPNAFRMEQAGTRSGALADLGSSAFSTWEKSVAPGTEGSLVPALEYSRSAAVRAAMPSFPCASPRRLRPRMAAWCCATCRPWSRSPTGSAGTTTLGFSVWPISTILRREAGRGCTQHVRSLDRNDLRNRSAAGPGDRARARRSGHHRGANRHERGRAKHRPVGGDSGAARCTARSLTAGAGSSVAAPVPDRRGGRSAPAHRTRWG